jgi:hypothetical protein
MNALKSWVISHVTVGLKTNVSETFSLSLPLSIIKVDVGNIHTLLITELCFLFRWLQSSVFWPGIFPFFMHPLPKASVACTMYYLPIIAFTM